MTQQEAPASERKGLVPWWHLVGYGLLMWVFAVYVYWDLTRVEGAGGSRSIRSFILLLYGLLGRWGVVSLLALFGAVLATWGLVDSRGKRTRN